MAPVQGYVTRGHQQGCAVMQGLLDNPNPLDVGGGLGKPMLLSCPWFPPQTNPGCTPPQIPVTLFALPPCSLSGNGQYSQFSGPVKLADLFFSVFSPRKKGGEKSDVQIVEGVPGLTDLL